MTLFSQKIYRTDQIPDQTFTCLSEVTINARRAPDVPGSISEYQLASSEPCLYSDDIFQTLTLSAYSPLKNFSCKITQSWDIWACSIAEAVRTSCTTCTWVLHAPVDRHSLPLTGRACLSRNAHSEAGKSEDVPKSDPIKDNCLFQSAVSHSVQSK